MLLAPALILFFMTGQVIVAAPDLSAPVTDTRLPGNWAWEDSNGRSGIYTFYDDETSGRFMTDNGTVAYIHTGRYLGPREEGSILMQWSDKYIGGTSVMLYFEGGTVSFSPDARQLFLSYMPYDEPEMIFLELHRTAAPSLTQLSGLWQGRRADGAEASVMFSLDKTVVINTDDRIINGTYLLCGEMLTTHLPHGSFKQDVIISKDGTRLIIIDFLGNAGEVVELVRG
jgi:hypothetical protein